MNPRENNGCSLRGKDHRQGHPVVVVARSLVEGEIRDFFIIKYRGFNSASKRFLLDVSCYDNQEGGIYFPFRIS
jgi:hypothetical protein